MTLTPTEIIQNRSLIILKLLCVFLALYTIQDFLPALLWGGIFAICIWPPYQKMERKFGKTIWLPLFSTLLILLLFLIPIFLVGYKLTDETQNVLNWIYSVRSFGFPAPNWFHKIPFCGNILYQKWEDNLSNPTSISYLLHSLKIDHSVHVTRLVGSEIVHRSILFIFSLLTLFFLLKNGDSLIIKSLRGSNRLFGSQGKHLAKQIVSSIHGTLSGLVLVGLGEGAVMGVIYIATATPQPLILAFITAICSMVPFLGWIAISIICLLIASKVGTLTTIIIWSIGAVVLFIADHFIRPALIGGSTKVPFLLVLLGILGGAEIWHLLGLFIGPAIMAVIHLFWLRWTYPTKKYSYTKYLNKKNKLPN